MHINFFLVLKKCMIFINDMPPNKPRAGILTELIRQSYITQPALPSCVLISSMCQWVSIKYA